MSTAELSPVDSARPDILQQQWICSSNFSKLLIIRSPQREREREARMATAAISPYAFDHVILLLDTEEFENPPSWLMENFNVIEGGTHAGE